MYNNTVLSEDRRRYLLEKTLEYRFNWINDQLQQSVVSIQKEDALNILKSLDEARRAKDCSPATTQPSPLEAEVAEIVPKTSSDLSAVKRMHLPFPKARLLLDRLEACQSLLRGEIAELGCRENHSLQGPVSETVKQIIREGFDDLISKDGVLQDEKIALQVQQVSVANNVVTKAEPTDSIASSLSDNNNINNFSHPTEYANNAFLSRLKDPRAATIVELLRSFVRSFLELDMAKLYSSIPDPDALDDSDEETSNSAETSRRENQPSQRQSMKNLPPSGPGPDERVRAFLTRVEETMRLHPLWRDDTPQQWEITVEELERFVMGKVYKAVFAVHPACSRRDAHLAARLQSLSFVRLKQLEIDEPSVFLAPGWKMAQSAIREMDNVMAPADKLACIMNSCRIIAMLLSAAAEERGKGGGGKGVGADEFLPALIYTVIKAQPRRLYSNLRYIGEFRSPTKLMSESGYFYTNVLSAVAFAKNVKPDHLAMSKTEFDACTRAARKRAEYRRSREVRRAVGSTAAARRSGEFKGLSGPASVAQGDFIDELATETRLLAYTEEAFSDDDEDDDDDNDDDDVVNEGNVNVIVDGISMVNFDEVPTKTSSISNVIAQPLVPIADKTTSKEVVNDALLNELQTIEKVVENEVVKQVHTLDPMLQRVFSTIDSLQLT
jgi:hypothetical protein